MTVAIAMAGKGGTGKTTIASMVLRCLRDRSRGSVLAIDADPSSNLNSALGMELEFTVGDVREETAVRVGGGAIPAGMAKRDYLEYRINEALVEGDRLDLIAMGRPEGAGCYCAANHVLRDTVDRLSGSYRYVVIDNEAGLEHLSRRTTRDVDFLLLVSDPTVRGLIAAGRIAQLTQEVNTRVGKTWLVVNRVQGELRPALMEEIARQGLDLIGTVPLDPGVSAYDADGKPLVELPEESAVYRSVKEIVTRMLEGKS